MNRIGIWIDHREAVIVSQAAGVTTTATVDSGIDGHPRFSAPRGAAGEQHYEARHEQQLDRFYDDVIGHLGAPDALLIIGPGEARLELAARLGQTPALAACAVDVEAADRLTGPQIVAKVKAHFVDA